MINYALLLPIILPLLGVITLLIGARSLTFQRIGGVFFACVTFVASLNLLYVVDQVDYLVIHMGEWSAPLGITMVADRFSAIMVAVSSFMGAAVAIYALSEIDEARLKKFFFPLYLVLIWGVNGAFLTGDLFNLYVWFEVMLIASFVLMSMGGAKEELEGGLKYVCLNLLSSVMFLIGAGMIYGKTGTLNMADIAQHLAAAENVNWAISSSMLLLVAFGLKAGMFPFFFWLPASYHTPPSAVSAVFAGLLTKVGVYALFRSYTLMFAPLFPEVQTIILWLAVLTMITGVLGAASQFDMRRILSFHIVSQIGYMVLGLAFMTPLAISAAIFYLVHHIIVKTNLFLVSGVVIRLKGSCDLSKVGGLAVSAPWLAVLFFIPAFSLGGIPPLSGFWAKFALVKSGIEIESWLPVTAALLVGVLTLYSMTKIWAEAFWKTQPEDVDVQPGKPIGSLACMLVPIVILAVSTILIGIVGEPLFAFSERAAAQLLNPESYISAVMPKVLEVSP
ncbi:Na(+) H(+) antiporter subunit D [Lentimonas sp. CC19]|nr:Na(+) H(+) antiporter subunit D [Lentimonas sp. CC10]CAA6695293.1 Na(+) H(+) antiporter subunit D [Lentimonas sp. CC19]CAA7068846.1 Na(+) H(+) antiporter subunit D [Lentimonas sp. CC11]